MKHTCHAAGCDRSCKPEYLMCAKHWRMVPRRIQSLVYRFYRDGQCELDPLPSKQWHAAADAAIVAVAVKEGRCGEDRLKAAIGKLGEAIKEGASE